MGYSYQVVEVFECSKEELFDLFWDVVWVPKEPSRVMTTEVLNEGDENKIGFVKLTNPIGLKEEIIHFDKGVCMKYKITEGPVTVKEYVSTVLVEDVEGGKSKLTWTGDFDGTYIGSMMYKGQLVMIYGHFVKQMKEYLKRKQSNL